MSTESRAETLLESPRVGCGSVPCRCIYSRLGAVQLRSADAELSVSPCLNNFTAQRQPATRSELGSLCFHKMPVLSWQRCQAIKLWSVDDICAGHSQTVLIVVYPNYIKNILEFQYANVEDP